MTLRRVNLASAKDHEIRLDLACFADDGCASAPSYISDFRVSEKGNCPVHCCLYLKY